MSPAGKPFFLATAGVGIAAQCIVAAMAWRSGGELRQVLSSIGVMPPLVTRGFLATYPWWLASPLVCGLLVTGVVRRPVESERRAVVVLILSIGAALGLELWLHAAWMEPLMAIVRQVR